MIQEPYTLTREGHGLLFVSHPRYGRQIWTLSTRNVIARYHERPCAICGTRLGVNKAYHPITNANNRMHRICEACGEKAT